MGKLSYGMLMSLDGFVKDRTGGFEWATPDHEVHAHANEEEARVSTEIYGRSMYEMMVYWETADQLPDAGPVEIEFARYWQANDKIVVSRSLTEVSSKRTRIVPSLSADAVRALKAGAPRNVAVSGPTLASGFLNQGLVDEIAVYCVPVIVGGGLPMFKDISHRIDLELLEERTFAGGVTFRRFAVRNSA